MIFLAYLDSFSYLAVPIPKALVRAPPTSSATTSFTTSNTTSPTDLKIYTLLNGYRNSFKSNHFWLFVHNGQSDKTRAPIGAWICNFPPFQVIMTDRPTDQPGKQQTDMKGNWGRYTCNNVYLSLNLAALVMPWVMEATVPPNSPSTLLSPI